MAKKAAAAAAASALKNEPSTDIYGRTTVLNLKGSIEQRAWIDSICKKTGMPASTLTRRALSAWAKANGHPAFPGEDD